MQAEVTPGLAIGEGTFGVVTFALHEDSAGHTRQLALKLPQASARWLLYWIVVLHRIRGPNNTCQTTFADDIPKTCLHDSCQLGYKPCSAGAGKRR